MKNPRKFRVSLRAARRGGETAGRVDATLRRIPTVSGAAAARILKSRTKPYTRFRRKPGPGERVRALVT